METRIIKGVIFRIPNNTQAPQSGAFYGKGRSLKPDNPGPIRSPTYYGKQRSPNIPDQTPTFYGKGRSLKPDIPVKRREEVDITSSITGPKIEPFSDFFIPSSRSDLTAVIFFPMDNDQAFSFSGEDFRKRIYFMSRELNIYGRRVNDLEQAINILAEIMTYHSVVHLEIGGHGDGNSIEWPNYIIKVGKDKELLAILFSMLAPQSTVHLLTCKGGQNIIDFLAKIGKGHRFISASCPIGNHLALKVDRAYPLDITYTDSNGNDVTVIRQY